MKLCWQSHEGAYFLVSPFPALCESALAHTQTQTYNAHVLRVDLS